MIGHGAAHIAVKTALKAHILPSGQNRTYIDVWIRFDVPVQNQPKRTGKFLLCGIIEHWKVKNRIAIDARQVLGQNNSKVTAAKLCNFPIDAMREIRAGGRRWQEQSILNQCTARFLCMAEQQAAIVSGAIQYRTDHQRRTMVQCPALQAGLFPAGIGSPGVTAENILRAEQFFEIPLLPGAFAFCQRVFGHVRKGPVSK
ncbi:hypothetical protein K3555_14530 [Leisingera sp. M527]|uniref:hypothetical protein n=1 Tax=Leisingera sp. M527 TaxID=2867014 RepID=UPI0021A63C0B|nr:hypothetical protein [Leisingera sp. M527]UWQ31795.1 hypothetical protein K3555_14530 [Leisingera sp. M527]